MKREKTSHFCKASSPAYATEKIAFEDRSQVLLIVQDRKCNKEGMARLWIVLTDKGIVEY